MLKRGYICTPPEVYPAQPQMSLARHDDLNEVYIRRCTNIPNGCVNIYPRTTSEWPAVLPPATQISEDYMSLMFGKYLFGKCWHADIFKSV